MLKQLTRSLSFLSLVAVFALAPSSALAGQHTRVARAHAHQGADARRVAGARARRERVAEDRAVAEGTSVEPATVLLGDRTIESHYGALAAGQAEAFRFRAAASGLTRAAHLYVSAANAAGAVSVGLYSDASGHPGSLLSSGSILAPVTGSWSSVTIAPVKLLAGSAYWLAVLGRGGVLRFRDRWHGGCASETSAQGSLGALSASWRSGIQHAACPISAYVTGGEAARPLGPVSPVEPSAPLPPAPAVPPAPVPPPGKTESTSAGTSSPPVETTPPATEPPATEPPPTEPPPTEPPPSEPPPTEPPPPAAPVNTVLPAIAGSATQGQLLSAAQGSWTGEPTSYAYQWQDCGIRGCVNVGGATSSSYELVANDIGDTVRVIVTASNAGGSAAATSVRTATVLALLTAPLNVLSPTVSGTAVEGETLSAAPGSWTGNPSSFSYQWQDCDSAGASCANVGGATASTRVLAPSDVGHTTRVVVNASNAAGSTEAHSAATATVPAAVSEPSGGGAPEPSCSVETESIATAKADLAIAGEVVCLKEAASPYASISISSGPSTSNSTLVAAPGKRVVVKSVTIAANHITVEGLHIEGGINVGTGNSTAYSHDTIAWNDISNPSGDGVGVFARVEGPVAEFIDIEHNKIHNTSVTSEGDAVHVQGWANLTVKENDIYAISEEACKGACHDDIFQTYNAGFKTAHDFRFEKNYVHDNDTEGILLKDGDTGPNVAIKDNLMIRDERWGGIAGIWVDDCTSNLVIEGNTLTEGNNIQPLSGSCVTPSATIERNVFGRMKLGGEASSGTYALTSEKNVFGEGAAGLYKMGSGDETKSLSGAGTYKCSPGCKTGNDDYRLQTNPKAAGIDWNPNEQSWGPNE
jgi:Right handed beta helix region